MSESFIYVKPSADPAKVKVLTELLGELEIPVYIGAHSDGTLIDEDSPLFVKTDAVTNSRILTALNELITEMKINNAYHALGHDEVITEEDLK